MTSYIIMYYNLARGNYGNTMKGLDLLYPWIRYFVGFRHPNLKNHHPMNPQRERTLLKINNPE